MKTALIGYTGFVGGNLDRQANFTDKYNSSNITEIAGKSYGLIVSAGQKAEIWRINQDPETDVKDLQALTDALDQANTEQLVLISTVSVYPDPVGVNEDSPIDTTDQMPYGRHRLELEQHLAERFRTLVFRLPGLFGPGLKKNVIYDFLTDNRDYFPKIHADSVYQFYNLERLWGDITTAREASLSVLNIATEPVTVAEVAEQCFGFTFDNRPSDIKPVRFNFSSKHAELFGGSGGYLYSKEQVLDEIKDFVTQWRTQNK